MNCYCLWMSFIVLLRRRFHANEAALIIAHRHPFASNVFAHEFAPFSFVSSKKEELDEVHLILCVCVFSFWQSGLFSSTGSRLFRMIFDLSVSFRFLCSNCGCCHALSHFTFRIKVQLTWHIAGLTTINRVTVGKGHNSQLNCIKRASV